MPDRHYLVEAREYAAGIRRALPDVGLVLGLLDIIETQTAELERRDRMLAGIMRGETVDPA